MLDSIRLIIHELEGLKTDLPENVRPRVAHLLDACVRLSDEVVARDAVERSRLHLVAIVESADLAIISKNMNGVIESWNPGAKRLFGYDAHEIIGQCVTRLLPQTQQGEEAKILERLARGERIEHYESIRQRKDGSLFPVSLTISPVRDKTGAIIGASKIARDMTDHKRFEEQATLIAQLQRALGEVKTLKGLLPICAWCKKIRDDRDYWHSLEDYLSENTDVQLTHGICPDCFRRETFRFAADEP